MGEDDPVSQLPPPSLPVAPVPGGAPTGSPARGRATDLGVSIGLLCAAPLVGLGAFLSSVLSVAGSMACHYECSWFNSLVSATFVVIPVVLLAGIIVTIVQLARRRRAWPWIAAAVGLTALIALAVLVGSFTLYN